MADLAEEIGRLLRECQLTLGVVESATGGLIAHLITGVAGSSGYFRGSVTAYHNDIKTGIIGVKKDTINRYGAVSRQVVEEMARGGQKLLGVDICLADTGIAGPGGATPEKPAGLFYLGLAHSDNCYSQKHIFKGNRSENKLSAATSALDWLREYLESH
ncbi:MAG: CinA family protein [Dehalococcoidales bacterium]|jgi:PncC family amidohydrolase